MFVNYRHLLRQLQFIENRYFYFKMLHVSAAVGPQQAFVSKHKYLLKWSMAYHFNASFYILLFSYTEPEDDTSGPKHVAYPKRTVFQ